MYNIKDGLHPNWPFGVHCKTISVSFLFILFCVKVKEEKWNRYDLKNICMIRNIQFLYDIKKPFDMKQTQFLPLRLRFFINFSALFTIWQPVVKWSL